MEKLCMRCKGFQLPPARSLTKAVIQGHVGCAKALLSQGMDPNALNGCSKFSFLDYAAQYGQIACMKFLIESGADVKFSKKTMALAAENGHYECVETLLKAGACVNDIGQKGYTALTSAAANGHFKCVNLLIKSGADVNFSQKSKSTPVQFDALNSYSTFHRASGADVNATDTSGYTALALAAGNGHLACVNLLLESGADVNLCKQGLALAAHSGHSECVEALLEVGADVNSSHNGTSAWLGALKYNHRRCLQLLVKAGADVNKTNNDGYTALMVAAFKNNLKHVQLLLEVGAHINIKCKSTATSNSFFFDFHAVGPDTIMVFIAAGETLDDTTHHLLPRKIKQALDSKLNLKSICRAAIRKHLLDLDPHSNLFCRVPQLGLPQALAAYLLFNVSLMKQGDLSCPDSCLPFEKIFQNFSTESETDPGEPRGRVRPHPLRSVRRRYPPPGAPQ